MIKWETGEASLEDVNEVTFGRFCQFMYTGDYGTPDPEGIVISFDELDIEMREKSKSRNRGWRTFCHSLPDNSGAEFEPRRNLHPSEQYWDVFRCHTQLYDFGDQYGIESLRALSQYKLHKTLTVLTLYPESCLEVIGTIQSIYDNTIDRPGIRNDLRDLVSQYAASTIDELSKFVEFDNLLKEAPAFARDVIPHFARISRRGRFPH